MWELAGNLPRGALLGDPTVISETVRPNPPDRVHGLTSCEPTPAPNPRVELSLTRTAALPNQMSESEMVLTLPDSSLLTRGAGRPNQTQRLEMSPPDKGHERTLHGDWSGIAPRVDSESENHLGLPSDSRADHLTYVTPVIDLAGVHDEHDVLPNQQFADADKSDDSPDTLTQPSSV